MEANLRLFGPVEWSHNERRVPVGGSVRVGIALRLAEANGAAVSVDSLLTDLWADVPKSGANAVQRHISALRRQLQELGVEHPTEVLQSVVGGYRLRASNDLARLEAMLNGDADEIDDVDWWEEPLVGAPWEATRALRTRLEALAEQALRRWAAGESLERAVEVATRAELMARHTPGCYEATRIKALAVNQLQADDRHQLTRTGRSTLRESIGLWSEGRGSESLDLLEDQADTMPADLVRRLTRSLIWLDHEEPWARHILSLLVEDSIANPELFERTVITMDARVLEEHPNGEDLVDAEIAGTTLARDRARALRVAILFRLSSPHSPKEDELIEHLSSIDLPDAQVEAPRFRFLAELRQGRFAQARRSLNNYESAVVHHWPGSGDDFAPMAAAALQLSPDQRVASAFGPVRPHIGGFVADRRAVPLAQAIRCLVQPSDSEPASDDQYFIAANSVSHTARTAMDLLRDHHRGTAVAERARLFAAALPTSTREKQFLLGPIALSLLGESLNDPMLSNAAAEALLPWSGQMLGLWPVDFCFGYADDWLERSTRML